MNTKITNCKEILNPKFPATEKSPIQGTLIKEKCFIADALFTREADFRRLVCLCLFRSQAIHSCGHPQGSGFLRARPFVLPPQGQSYSDFGEKPGLSFNVRQLTNGP